MTTIQVTESMLIDAVPLAESIEMQFGQYLKPVTPGFYLPNEKEPAMVPGEEYYQFIVDLTVSPTPQPVAVPVEKIEDIVSAVFDKDAEIVIPARRVKQVLTAPSLPFRGIEVIQAVIEDTIAVNVEWGRNVPSDIIVKSFHPDFADFAPHEIQLQIIEAINDLLIDLRRDVAQFIARAPWFMYFVREWVAGNLILERTIDYRVWAWEQEHGEEFRKQRK